MGALVWRMCRDLLLVAQGLGCRLGHPLHRAGLAAPVRATCWLQAAARALRLQAVAGQRMVLQTRRFVVHCTPMTHWMLGL